MSREVKRKEKETKEIRALHRLREEHILYTGISGCFFVLNKDVDLFIKVVARGKHSTYVIVQLFLPVLKKKQIKEKR